MSTHTLPTRRAATVRLAWLLAACLLAAGCAAEAPPAAPGATEAPAVTPAATSAAPAPPPTSTPAPVSTPALAATPAPAARATITGRLLYARRGNLYELSGAGSRQMTSTGDLAWPRWSPDGEQIAVVRRGDAFSDLHLLDRQGQHLAQLTRHQSKQPPGSKEYAFSSIWATWPAWEPGGARLIYAADVTASNMALWQVDVKGGQPRPLPATADLGANIECPAYAPDGKSLVFCLSYDTPTQLWIANLAGGGRSPLTDGKQTVYDPAWSPDGKALAVAIIDGTHSSLWLLSPDGKQRTPLVRRPAARAPTWSPDGAQLAFIGEEGGQFNVYVVDLTTDGAGGYAAGEPRRLTSDGDVDAPSGLSWAR
jgi:Tol biopolymer transport system component